MGPTSGVSLSDKYKNLQNTQIKKKRKKKRNAFWISPPAKTHTDSKSLLLLLEEEEEERAFLSQREREISGWKDVDFNITLQVSHQRTINQLFGKLNTKSRFNLNGINSKFHFSVFAIVLSCLFVFFSYKKLLTCVRFWFDYVLAPFKRRLILFQSSRFFLYIWSNFCLKLLNW